jgi:hypothetical protein
MALLLLMFQLVRETYKMFVCIVVQIALDMIIMTERSSIIMFLQLSPGMASGFKLTDNYIM